MSEEEALTQDLVEVPMTYFKLNEERRNVVDQIIDKLYESQKEKEDDSRGEN